MFSKPKEYDQATQLLKDLHVIARREDDIAAFTARVRELRTRYTKRPSLMNGRQGRTAATGIADECQIVTAIIAAGGKSAVPSCTLSTRPRAEACPRRPSPSLPPPGPTLLEQDTTKTTFMRYR